MARGKSLSPLIPPSDIRQRWAEVLSPHAAAAVELLFTLRETAHELDKVLASWLGEDALTPGRWQIMVTLWSMNSAVTPADIARILKLSRATVSEHLENLRAEGLVTVTKDMTDGRKQAVTLSGSGSKLIERLIQENAARLVDVFGSMNADGLREVTEKLAGLRKGWQEPQLPD